MPSPANLYQSLMQVIRQRFDLMNASTNTNRITYVAAENVAYNARKIVEAIAFGCLIALDHSLNSIPRDAKGQRNAEDIFKSLQKKGLQVWPEPADSRLATPEEKVSTGAAIVVENQPHLSLTPKQVIDIYRRLHRWAHELNPYLDTTHNEFLRKNVPLLMADVKSIAGFISNHTITIRGRGFYSVLKDEADGCAKLVVFERK